MLLRKVNEVNGVNNKKYTKVSQCEQNLVKVWETKLTEDVWQQILGITCINNHYDETNDHDSDISIAVTIYHSLPLNHLHFYIMNMY